MGNVIEVVSVTKTFGDVTALDEVSLQIRENEFFALLGPSGCGKTTLLRILAGFETPDSGQVLLDGTDIVGVKPFRRPVNMMFQNYALFPHMTVWRNVAYGLRQENIDKAEIDRRVGEILEMVSLSPLAERKPHQLSGGQSQRVALARAVVKRPRVLLLDEPLAALDRQIRGEMQLELKRLQHEVGITFVIVTHDQDEAMSMADRIAVMSDARVLQVDDPVSLYENPQDLFVAGFIGTMNFLPGEVGAETISTAVGDFVLPPGRPGAGPGRLAVRPETIGLSLGEGEAGRNSLRGTVADVSFYGAMTHVHVEVEGLDRPLVVTNQGPLRLEIGAAVTLTWPPEAAVVLLG